ncbi:uncharacterized protein LOC126762942 isoform X2 [Bactrocera neohumeralis]|uniref:uncharacterized protein LOC126762942 isoform X2 n=1 Tax=Bactrocera neohumeralis TaxID=98809 RepID=UPI002166B911|nr:uncharacterized protein LOC126762942 isoform X2 [Bactrocera neohumeralis]
MGFRYQELKDRGDSIELEHKESYTTERSHNGYIKRHKTVLRERFPHPNAKEARKQQKQHTKRSAYTTTLRPETASERNTTTETFGNSPESGALLTTCRDKSHLERAVNRTSVQLKRLAHEIDNEIAKLKRERDKLMFRSRPHPLMRNAAIQNDLHTKIESLDKLKDFDTQFANNIEFTIEKFSSQHKFVCTSPRYARDEQTSCRPRMRTIGLQKDTQRGGVEDNLQNLKAKLNAAIHYSATNLAALKTKGLLDTTPPNCYAFDYGGTGDGQSAVNVYHLQNCRCTGGCNPNDCNCMKTCERYNNVGNYNGMLCNKNTYVEKAITPCKEYKYCRDEYHYNYPSQNKCVVPAPNQSCVPCSPCVPCFQPCQPCQPCTPCLPPCPTYNECQAAKPQAKVIYGRRVSDLNTEDFYHPTASHATKSFKHGSPRHSKNKERLTVDVPKDGRTLVDIERSGDRSRSKTRRKNESEDKTRQRSAKAYDVVPARKASEKRQVRERKPRQGSESSGSVDSSEKARQMKSKEKLLEITFTKERRHKPSSESDECITYELPKASREYSRETKRSLKQMTITAYKPCKPGESEGKYDLDRKKKQKSKAQSADDDKTWDERLRKMEYPPEPDEWHAGIPTITEVLDDYRIGDTYASDVPKIIQGPTDTQYRAGYGEFFQLSPQRSYDIMPVQKNTVRDLPPSQSPERGRRIQRESPMRSGEKPVGSHERERTVSGTGRDEQPRIGRVGRQRESYEKDRSEVFRAYGLEEKPRIEKGYRSVGKQDTERSYGRAFDERRSPTEQKSRLDEGYRSVGKPDTERSYGRAFDERRSPSAQKPRLDEGYRSIGKQGAERSHGRTYDERQSPSEQKPRLDEGYRSIGKQGAERSHGRTYDELQSPSEQKPRLDEGYRSIGKQGAERSHGRPYDEQRTPRDYVRSKQEGERRESNTLHDDTYEPKFTSSTPRSARDYERGITSDERYDPRGSPRKAYDESNSAQMPGRTYTPDETPRSARYETHSPTRLHSPTRRMEDPHTYTPDAKPRFARGLKSDDNIEFEGFSPSHSRDDYEKPEGKRSSKDHSETDQRVVTDPGQTSESKVRKEEDFKQEEVTLMRSDQLGDIDLSSKKTEISAADMKYKADTQKAGTYTDDYSPKADIKAESTDTTQRTESPTASIPRTGNQPGTDRGFTGSEEILEKVPPVPEITIEDTDESGRSAPSGRGKIPVISLREQAKSTIQGEMSPEPEQLRSPKYKDRDKLRQLDSRSQPEQIRSSPVRQPGIHDGAVIGGGFTRSDTAGVMGGSASPLSPFPSLETPKIYMKPRALCTDYGTACFPPTEDDCTKRTSLRANCVANAGDAYMCKPCTTQTTSPSASPRQCLCPAENGCEIPYEKLGDQYEHSPVRQLAANSHMAVALQSDTAIASYKPLPQQSLSKSCITLRSTGTQYSATIIEQKEDRCAPQYVPLPKECSEIYADQAKKSAAPSTCTCDSSRQSQKSPLSTSDSMKTKYQFLCEENNEEQNGKVQIKNNEEWCGRVDINSEKRQIFIAQHKQKPPTQCVDEQNYLLPWQQDEKFIPGQPISSCNMTPWQNGPMKLLQTVQKSPRFQNYAERRTPRFNATMPPHQEMPEEEDRCAEELSQYKPQTRVQFMEQYSNCDPACYAQDGANLQNETAEPMRDCTPRGRLSFAYGGEYQQVPEFTGCPCMFKTYLNMVTLYYPDYRVQLREDCVEIEDDDDECNE